jgi:crossover junction endodeoxyribonuclease RusA
MTVTLTLPYPPSANRLWVRARKGMRRSDEYVKWLTEAGWTVKSQKPGRVDGAYKLSIHAVRPDRRARDVDNLIKPTSDLLQHIGVIRDDSDAEMVSARWVTSGQPFTVIVEPAGREDA